MADTTGITGKRKTGLWLPILLIHNFGRLAMGTAGASFLLLGAIALVYSCYELIYYLTQGEKNAIAVFVQCAEYYLITLTFVLVGQVVMNLAYSTESKTEDLGKLKESLLAMIISISGVAFIELILGCEAAAYLGIDILYVGRGNCKCYSCTGYFYPPGYAQEGRIIKQIKHPDTVLFSRFWHRMTVPFRVLNTKYDIRIYHVQRGYSACFLNLTLCQVTFDPKI